MAWTIKCTSCQAEARARNIVDLLEHHTDESGWFVCPNGHSAYIEKSFPLQEGGNPWEPFLRGAIRFRAAKDIYQPFVFLVSNTPDGPVTDAWFSYYKDLSQAGGRLKLGYGPGGPPVLGKLDILELVRQMVALGCLSADEVRSVLVKHGMPW